MRRSFLGGLVLAILAVGPARAQTAVTIDRTHTIATVDSRYVSFAIDAAELVGGPWWSGSTQTVGGRGNVRATPIDLSNHQLQLLAASLAPAVLRVGGTEADLLAYDLSATPAASPPKGYDTLLTATRWQQLTAFARSCGLDLMFTLDAGPTERVNGSWQPEHAQALLDFAQAHGDEAAVWELGNEPNAYWLTFGLADTLSGSQYAQDYETARTLVRGHSSGSQLAGPTTAFWPLLGEPLGFLFGVTQPFLENVQGGVDLVTWHFYPTQSDRTPIQLVPATQQAMLDPGTLNEASKWADQVTGWRDSCQPGSTVWLGETGPAQCGGQPGLSDTFASAFWWLDQLGSLATKGVALQVRQTLAGSDYGMLADDFTPNPDFWGSLIWKTLMGEGVLPVTVSGGDGLVRAYAHETAARAGVPKGSATLLLLNLSTTKTETVQLPGITASTWAEYVVTAPAPTSKTISLNGTPLALGTGGSLPAIQGRPAPARASIDLAPLSYELLVLPP